MKKIIKFAVVFITSAIITCLAPLNIHTAYADDQDLFTQGSSYVPNVLIILDNSQSMDEDFSGNLVCPWRTTSRLVEAKRQLQAIVNKYANSMRIGLMTYSLPGVSNQYVHNAVYFASYDPKSYCPLDPLTPVINKPILDACQAYCNNPGDTTSQGICQTGCSALNPVFDATYLDEIITNTTVNSAAIRKNYCEIIYPKTQMADANATIIPHTFIINCREHFMRVVIMALTFVILRDTIPMKLLPMVITVTPRRRGQMMGLMPTPTPVSMAVL